ncbi:MAG: hypothetical protein GDA46_00360 [Bdellovibrionales bacterium]|nr:hypothetical protein [Bdellovibrionales bacterium]
MNSSLKESIKFKLFISPYSLRWKKSKNPGLEGTLFAFDFGSKQIGYSDFLPWPSFGEKTLSCQLEDIKKGKESQRFKIAKYNAFIDAQARKEKRNLFFSLNFIPSHFLIEDINKFKQFQSLKNFKTVKVKLKAKNKLEQTEALRHLSEKFPHLKLRLDLNGDSFKEWNLSFLKEKIDFIEDPYFSSLHNFSILAEDWLACSEAQVKIVKPSRDFVFSVKNFWNKKRIIFTHSFDHPLGQVSTLFWASLFYKYYPSFFDTGSFLNFHRKKVSNYPLEYRNELLIPPKGFGFGFSRALKEEKWEKWI